VKNILVTGSSGFIGKNLIARLRTREDITLLTYDIEDDDTVLQRHLSDADIIFHLAGVNRPVKEEEFETGNAGLTNTIVESLKKNQLKPTIVLSSSIQADLENPYGRSKRKAELILRDYSRACNAAVSIFRLPNVYGKWCRPHYNSVAATFCHQIAHDLPVTISDPIKEIYLVYIDDVVKAFLSVLEQPQSSVVREMDVTPIYKITLGRLAESIQKFRAMRKTLVVDDMSDRFLKTLYATYLSYLEKDDFGYHLTEGKDDRGVLAEMFKSNPFGQIFVSRTKPGITRGNHYHHSKTEKFCVLEGEAVIRFRHILGKEVITYPVSGMELKIVDIPPGYTHSIENTGQTEMITLFWSSELFNPDEPDTFYESVLK
jgi:UDP-2-acetamido-2,6-beta-L-arabino-hexul-4-ose reductase